MRLSDLFLAKEQEYGLPAGYLSRTAQIESKLNPSAKNPHSSAGGLFQFIDSTARDYGLTDRFNPEQATDAAARLARDNAKTLRGVLGRDPTGGELYLAHQQGGGGAANLLRNAASPASGVVGSEAVSLNGGKGGQTSGDFANQWISKFNEPGGAVAAVNALAGETGGGTSMAANGPKMPQGIGGLGGLGGFVPPQADDGFDTGGLLRALAAAAFAGDASVIPQMLSQSEAQRDKRYDRQYDRAWDQYTLGASQQESALDRQARADDRADNNRFREADDRRADASLKLQQQIAGQKDTGATDDTREYEYAVGRGYTGSFPEWQLAQKRAGASSVTIGGGENKQVFDAMAESASGARAAVSGLKAIRDARQAIDAGGIFGAGADTRLGLQKVGAYLGVTDPSAITNTETFRAAIAPQVSAVLKSTVGSANISNTDREFAEKAAGGNITLEPASIKRLLTIMEKASTEAVAGHTSRLDRVYPAGDQFERERALFGVDMPDMTAAPIEPPNTGGQQQNASGAPAKPTSDEEYNALPSGSLFIDPDDGKTYRKP